MDPINYLRVAGGRWRIIVVTCLVGLLAGWVTTPGPAEVATGGAMVSATHTLLLEAGTSDARGGTESGQSLEVTALLVQEGPVPERVAAILDSDSPGQLGARVQAITDARVGTVSIVATGTDPDRAAVIANTFASELLAYLVQEAQARYTADLEQEQQLVNELQAQLDGLPAPTEGQDAERNALTRRFDDANSRLQTLEEQGAPTAGFTTLDEASAEEVVPAGSVVAPTDAAERRAEGGQAAATPSADGAAEARVRPPEDPPNRPVRMLLGGAVGLILGVGLALLRERFDTRIRSKEGAEQAFGLFVLAEIPRLRRRRRPCEVASVDNGRELEAEAYRVLRTALLFHRTTEPTVSGTALGAIDSLGTGTGPIETMGDLDRARRRLPVLGLVPALPDVGDLLGRHRSTGTDAASPLLQAVRELHTPLAPGEQGGVRTLQITSAMPGDGKTTTAAHLAIELARSGLSVSLVDCDLHQPSLHELFGMPNAVGLTSVVAGEVSVSVACRPITEVERLSVVPCGPPPPDPSKMLASPRLGEVLASLTVQSDVVVLDGPPVLPHGDALLLADRVGTTILVARQGVTRAIDLRDAVDALERAGAPSAGIVLNQGQEGRAPATQVAGSSQVADGWRPGTGRPIDGAPGPGRNHQVLLVTSPGNSEGKTSTAANLAAAFAETGPTVLVLDFDLRRPQLHEFFATARSPGLSDVLQSPSPSPNLAEVIRPTPVPQVQVAASGSPAASLSGLLPKGHLVVEDARRLADVVVLDTPPVLAASDASQLIPAADGVVVVCRAGTTTTEEAARCAEQLARMGAPVLGVVLLGTPVSPVARSYAARSRPDGKAKLRRSPQPRPATPVLGGPSTPAPTADDTSRTPAASSSPFRTSGNGTAKPRTRSKKRKPSKLRS